MTRTSQTRLAAGPVAERRRRILLAAVATYRPASIDDLRRCPTVALWQESAFEAAVADAIEAGAILDSAAPGEPLVVADDGRWTL